jgi:hypothetical protein
MAGQDDQRRPGETLWVVLTVTLWTLALALAFVLVRMTFLG